MYFGQKSEEHIKKHQKTSMEVKNDDVWEKCVTNENRFQNLVFDENALCYFTAASIIPSLVGRGDITDQQPKVHG